MNGREGTRTIGGVHPICDALDAVNEVGKEWCCHYLFGFVMSDSGPIESLPGPRGVVELRPRPLSVTLSGPFPFVIFP